MQTMPCLIDAHLLEYRARARIAGGKLFQVRIQVIPDLFFRFRYEAQTGFIAGQSGEGADRKRTGIPERIQDALTSAQLIDPRGTPCKMIRFLLSGRDHGGLRAGSSSGECLARIERLRSDFSRMIDPHQRRDMLSIGLRGYRVRYLVGGIGSGGGMDPGQCAERLVKPAN